MVFNATFNNISIFFYIYIVAVSFIGGGNRSTWRKSPICRKSLTNFIKIDTSSTHIHYHSPYRIDTGTPEKRGMDKLTL
jgi:hypothetical protein